MTKQLTSNQRGKFAFFLSEPDTQSAVGAGVGSSWVWNQKCKVRALVYIEHSRTSGQPMSELEWNERWKL